MNRRLHRFGAKLTARIAKRKTKVCDQIRVSRPMPRCARRNIGVSSRYAQRSNVLPAGTGRPEQRFVRGIHEAIDSIRQGDVARVGEGKPLAVRGANRGGQGRLGGRIEADVQGEDVPDVICQSIGTDGGMIAEGVGHLVDHEIGRDEPDLPAHMPVAEGKRCLAVPLREEPLGDDGGVYDRRLRSRHRRISFVLSYSLGPTWARNSSMRRAASRALRRSIGARSRSSRSRRRSTASRKTSDQLRSRIRAILFFIVPSTLKLTTSIQGKYYL